MQRNGVVIFLLLSASPFSFAETKQEHVHNMSHHVMHFDMSSTLHRFRMTESGGIQQVVARNAEDSEQIGKIRKHLLYESKKFARGDYSDPAALHGEDMPGLAELSANPEKVSVSYADLADGGEITYETSDRAMLTAIHRWFGAQLSEHGADAVAE